MQWLRVGIFIGMALRQTQYALKRAWYVKVRGSVHWKGVRLGEKFLFYFIIKIDQFYNKMSYVKYTTKIDQSQTSRDKIDSKGEMQLTTK